MRSLLLALLAGLSGFGLARWKGKAATDARVAPPPAPAAVDRLEPELPVAASPNPAIDRAKSIGDRLSAALRSRSSLESAPRALAVIGR